MSLDVERINRLLHILRAHPAGISESELTAKSGLAPEIIHSLLTTLSNYYDFSLVVRATRCPVTGQETFWQLEVGKYLPLLSLSPLEILLLLSFLETVKSNDNLARVKGKLLKLLKTSDPDMMTGKPVDSIQSHDRSFNKATGSGYDLKPRLKTVGSLRVRPPAVYANVRRALFQQQWLKILYRAKHWPEAREITGMPLGLVLNQETGFWYLVLRTAEQEGQKGKEEQKGKKEPKDPESREGLYCKEAYKDGFYHLNRIQQAKILPQKFKYPADFDLRRFMAPRWGVDMSPPVRVKVRFYNEANVIDKVRSELTCRGLPVSPPEEDGSLTFCQEVYGITSFFKWVLSFGSSAEILEPPELRARAIAVARKWAGLDNSSLGY